MTPVHNNISTIPPLKGTDIPPTVIKYLYFKRKIIRIIANISTRDSFRELFTDMKILLMYSQYTYSFFCNTQKIHLMTINVL